jgi:tRNA dimethylallyltransferase
MTAGNTVWIIAGPTAGGKSALAAELAAENDGIVINADSMQIYKEIPIISAQPSAEEKSRAEHLLYGFHPVTENFSAASWAIKALEKIRAVHAQKKRAVLVGGSGLYFRALVTGFAPIPKVPRSVRKQVSDLYDMLGGEEFHGALNRVDPQAAARLHPEDRQRMIRAREVFEATGRPLTAWQQHPSDNIAPDLSYRAVLLLPEKSWLHERINLRFEHMVANGALDEAEKVSALNPDASLTGTKALGLNALRDHLDGKITLKDAVAQGQLETRQYAKRQMTWFRGQKTADKALILEKPELERAQEFLHNTDV